MEILYKTKKSQLKKIKAKNYSLTLDNEFRPLLAFYTKNLNITKKTDNGFFFNAKNVINLDKANKKDGLSYDQCKLLFLNLQKQIEILHDKGISPITLKESEIYYIENDDKPNCFILLNLDNIYEIEKNNIQILTPFYQHKFFSPELKKFKSFPLSITKKTIYYSLGLLVMNCLAQFETKLTDDFRFDTHIEMIKETKLYWALLRLVEKEPQNRFCLFI